MNTPQLITYIFNHPNSGTGEWVKVYGTHKKVKAPHWFKVSNTGSTTVFHKLAEVGQEEGFAQDTMREYYRKFSWSVK